MRTLVLLYSEINHSMPTITQLEYIIAVDQTRHFGEAAKQCFVTQPTLSAQIKKAEDVLGVLIFDRQQQPVVPTQVGRLLIEQARLILREHRQLHQLVADTKETIGGTLSIGIIPTIAPYLLPLFVGKFVRQYPKVKLQVHELTTEQIIEQLRTDQLDLGLLVTPLQEDDLLEYPLYYEEIQLYVHPKHRFAQTDSVALTHLHHQDMWLLSQGHCFRHQVINLCALRQEAQNKLPFSYEGGSLEALQRLVDQEGGFTLLPELAALHDSCRVRPLEPPVPLREVSLVHRSYYAKHKLLEVLQAAIREALPPHMLQNEQGQVVEWR